MASSQHCLGLAKSLLMLPGRYNSWVQIPLDHAPMRLMLTLLAAASAAPRHNVVFILTVRAPLPLYIVGWGGA